jgi:hypothetical protein
MKTEPTDNIRTWLDNLYDEAIIEANKTLGNERIWQKGSSTDEEIQIHEDNIREQERYITVLEELKDNIQFL